jgi:internalin A
MKNVTWSPQPGKPNSTAPACPVVAMCGALMLAPLVAEQRDPRAQAIAALAEVGGVLRYDNLNRPVWLGFGKAKRDVDDAALANVAKLDTLEEIAFFCFDLPLSARSRHPSVTDRGLAHLRGLPRLRALDLTGTGVRGPGLAQLHANKQLTKLTLFGLPLGDDGLKYLAGFHSLAGLWLSDDGITGKGLAHLAGLTNLRLLSLTCRSISPEGLARLSRMTYLNELHLEIRELDHIEFLRNFTRLTWLSLKGTSIADADLADIAGLTRLTVLDLGDTQIGDGALRHLAGLSNLVYLRLRGTRITDAGLGQLTSLSKCEHLIIQRTAVTPEGEARLKAKYPSMRIVR